MFEYIKKLLTEPQYQHSILDAIVLFVLFFVVASVLAGISYAIFSFFYWLGEVRKKRKAKKSKNTVKFDKGENK